MGPPLKRKKKIAATGGSFFKGLDLQPWNRKTLERVGSLSYLIEGSLRYQPQSDFDTKHFSRFHV